MYESMYLVSFSRQITDGHLKTNTVSDAGTYFRKETIMKKVTIVLQVLAMIAALVTPGVMAADKTAIENSSVFVIFGPEDYARTGEEPETFLEAFSVSRSEKTHFMRIYNGGNAGQFEKMVSSAVIALNDATVVRPSHFNQNTQYIDDSIFGLFKNVFFECYVKEHDSNYDFNTLSSLIERVKFSDNNNSISNDLEKFRNAINNNSTEKNHKLIKSFYNSLNKKNELSINDISEIIVK